MRKDGKIKVAFPTSGFMYWNGGLDFLKNLIDAYCEYCKKNNVDVDIFIVLPKSGFVNKLKNIIKRLLKRTVVDEQKVYRHFGDIKNVTFLYSDYDIENQAKQAVKYEVDVLLPCFFPLENSNIKWIGYLFDCQHIGLPENFSNKEIADRNHDFQVMLNSAKSIVVNSVDTKLDIVRNFEPTKCEINSLPFCPTLKDSWMESIIHSEHAFEYYIVCNQFWKHKNHITVIQAFIKYCEEGGEKNLICTGALTDYRNDDYYYQLKHMIDTSEYSNRIIITGFIDKSEQIRLLYNASALIQPTLFEGGPGGGAAFDAVALGKPVILSDININYEVDSDNIKYFPRLSARSLATTMHEFDSEVFDKKTIEELVEKSNRTKEVLGAYINELVNETYANK